MADAFLNPKVSRGPEPVQGQRAFKLLTTAILKMFQMLEVRSLFLKVTF